MNSFAGIFWLVLAQLQNQFFAEHLPVAAYERCLKEKEWKKQSSVFIVLSLTFFFVALQLSVGEIRTNYEHFSLKNENKIRKTSLKQNLLVLMKKKRVYLFVIWLVQCWKLFCIYIFFTQRTTDFHRLKRILNNCFSDVFTYRLNRKHFASLFFLTKDNFMFWIKSLFFSFNLSY